MLLFALAILGFAEPQTGISPSPAVAAPEVYRRPAVAPYEPPSDFGRQQAEGDADARPRRLGGRPDAEGDYEAAVEDRRRAAQALMGPLDGLWRITDEQGRSVLTMALTDPGAGGLVEGAWTRTTPQGVVRSGMVGPVIRDGASVDIEVATGVTVTLHEIGGRWFGHLSEGRRQTAVSLTPGG